MKTFILSLIFVTFSLASYSQIGSSIFFEPDEYKSQIVGKLKTKVKFPKSVLVMQLIDSTMSLADLRLPPEYTNVDSIITANLFFAGNWNELGYLTIITTMREERFLVCSDQGCHLLIINTPVDRRKRYKFKFQYRDTRVYWNEDYRRMETEFID